MITQQDLERLDHLRRKEIPRIMDKQYQLQSRVELSSVRLGESRSSAMRDKYAEYVADMEDLTEKYKALELEEERMVLEIMRAIRILPGEISDVIYMRYVQRMSFGRIAHELHQSESTIYRRHRKGLEMLTRTDSN